MKCKDGSARIERLLQTPPQSLVSSPDDFLIQVYDHFQCAVRLRANAINWNTDRHYWRSKASEIREQESVDGSCWAPLAGMRQDYPFTAVMKCITPTVPRMGPDNGSTIIRICRKWLAPSISAAS